MAYAINTTFLIGVFLLAYLGSFVFFAIIRIVTGVSIQRLGYFSVRGIAFTRHGVEYNIKRAGLVLHRPTFAQPTWISVVIREAVMCYDPKLAQPNAAPKIRPRSGSLLNRLRQKNEAEDAWAHAIPGVEKYVSKEDMETIEAQGLKERLATLELMQRITRLQQKCFRWIQWLKFIDLLLTNTTLKFAHVATLQFGSIAVTVDTRLKSKEVDESFNYCANPTEEQHPVEATISFKSALLSVEGRDPVLIFDYLSINSYGVLEKKCILKDVTLSLKTGKVNLPLDDIQICNNEFKKTSRHNRTGHDRKASLSSIMSEMSLPGSRTERMVETVMESKEILTSILSGVLEIQFAIAMLEISTSTKTIQPGGKPLKITMALKDCGLDLHRLDQDSPAHRMDFSPDDIAHQALLAAISLSLSVDDRQGNVDKIFYVPMATITLKTTLPSKTIQLAEKAEADRNANILNANMVVTSPSIDLKPRHLPMIIALLQNRNSSKGIASSQPQQLISRLLPKANLKFTVHEPVIRVLLPSYENKGDRLKCQKEMDMLISSASSMSLDLESSHSSEEQNHYMLTSSIRLTNQKLFYRAASGERHDLFQLEAVDFKAQLDALPEVRFAGHCVFDTLSVRLVQPEIVQGIREMVSQFQKQVKPKKLHTSEQRRDPNLLRSLPEWIVEFKIEGRDFGAEVAGVDKEVSEQARGAAIQLDAWALEYKIQQDEKVIKKIRPRRKASRAIGAGETVPLQPAKQYRNPTDGKHLSFHIYGLEAYMVDGDEIYDSEPICTIPHFETGMMTKTDKDGTSLNISSHTKSIFIHYSLFKHYAVLVAAKVVRETFSNTHKKATTKSKSDSNLPQLASELLSPPESAFGMNIMDSPIAEPEFVSVDIRIKHVKVKATVPNDPPMMLELFQLEAGRVRYGFPFIKTRNLRLYVDSPTSKGSWARVISAVQFRGDLRETRHKTGKHISTRESFDLSMNSIRIAIPHQMVLYNITDNIMNTIKASQQLHHRYKTGTNEYILEKQAEKPKKMPRVSLRAKALQFEIEDDPFEVKLSMIYRIGLSEQKNRLAREEAFKAKAAILADARNKRKASTNRGLGLETDTILKTGKEPVLKKNHRNWKGRVQMRYDVEDAQEPSATATVSVDKAWQKLQEHNSQVWIKRMKWMYPRMNQKIEAMRRLFMGSDEIPSDIEEKEKILPVPMRPALMMVGITDLDLLLDRPSFEMSELPKFMYKVGKGLPEDTQFSLLLPMNVQLNMGEARISLRDYPLPFLYVPQMRPSQSARLPSWTLKTDFVLAEELRNHESMRHVLVDVIPKEVRDGKTFPGFAIDVRRTVSPVKSYSDIAIMINTSYATRITWGNSYQPAIQDMMMVIETFTKPHVDPSEKIGFWDKLRLSMHSRIRWAWKGDGDIHLTLKGSRDPYVVTGNGAGFVMCWRGDVCWDISYDESPQKFMMVESEEYLLAIPDFSLQAMETLDISNDATDTQSISSTASYKSGAIFKKVIMKVAGRVRWQVGLAFEQETGGSKDDWTKRTRSFDFIPHYEVTLKSPEFAKAPPGEVYDAFKGFRSHHLHLSISVVAPLDHDWTESKPSVSYNAIHLTPRFFTHFYAWWGLFSGVMSLPIRQGPLWPGVEKSTKKFGRHLATIKYKLLLSPLFISHVYKHKDAEEYAADSKYGNDTVTATGLKVRLDSFLLDIHQRKEESVMKVKGLNIVRKSTNMSIHQAELDFHTADIRAVSASIAGTTADDVQGKATEDLTTPDNADPLGDSVKFTIADGDLSWVDVDDFVELDWILPTRSSPETKIMPLAFTPRFTYFRQTDHSSETGIARSSPFGNEATHDCVMSHDTDPREIQCGLIQTRLEKVNLQMKKNKDALHKLSEDINMDSDNQRLKNESLKLIDQSSVLHNKIIFLQNMLRRMSQKLDDDSLYGDVNAVDSSSDSDSVLLDSVPFVDFVNDFENRFVVHNMQAKWNNSLRNIILRYIHQVNQRRGFVYYLSRRAIKFILDLVEEQKQEKAKRNSDDSIPSTMKSTLSAPLYPSAEEIQDESVQARIQALLDDVHKVAVADDDVPKTRRLSETIKRIDNNDLTKGISDEYVPLNSYHVRLIAPQLQFQSEKNTGSALLVTSQGMQLKVISVMDKERMGDDVSGLVQRRFALDLENAQAFVARRKDFTSQVHWLHSANRYGTDAISSWPPWVPLENMFDFLSKPHGFSRVVQKTSTTFRFDKHNSLRLKLIDTGLDAGGVSPIEAESRIDHVWATFEKVEVSCNSIEYFSLYIIVLDLLLYSEPLEKSRNERLEKIMLASDFSDLSGAPDLVISLQNRIQQLEEIKIHFQINSRYLDKQGWEDRLSLEKDLVTCEDELFFLMKSIMSVQRKYDDRQQTTGVMRWFLSATEIVAHLLRGKDQPFVDLKLENASYERTDNSDSSNFNTLEIEMLKGLNRLPDAIYPTMLAPFMDRTHETNKAHQTKILRVYWYMLEAIAGIPVMDHFEVNLFPLQIQLDRGIGEKLFEYIFPGMDANAFEKGSFSPFMVQSSVKDFPDESDDSSDDDDNNTISSHRSMPMDDSAININKELSVPLQNRLIPTMTADSKRPPSRNGDKITRPKTAHSDWQFRGLKPKHSAQRQASYDNLSAQAKKGSEINLRSSLESARPATSVERPSTMHSVTRNNSTITLNDAPKVKQLFHRPGSRGAADKDKKPDEISQMITRASNYMTLAYIKIPSVVLCLSYKGKGERNIEDIHEFVFRMPTLEYRNKMWSNLDLALRMKKDVIKALISHTGALLENKIMHHRPHQPKNTTLRHMITGAAATASSIFFEENQDSMTEQGDEWTPNSGTTRSTSSKLSAPSLRRKSSATTMRSSGSSSLFHGTTGNNVVSFNDMRESEGHGESEEKHGLFHNTLGRHLSILSSDRRARDGIAGESEESIRKKSRLLLGKKSINNNQ